MNLFWCHIPAVDNDWTGLYVGEIVAMAGVWCAAEGGSWACGDSPLTPGSPIELSDGGDEDIGEENRWEC